MSGTIFFKVWPERRCGTAAKLLLRHCLHAPPCPSLHIPAHPYSLPHPLLALSAVPTAYIFVPTRASALGLCFLLPHTVPRISNDDLRTHEGALSFCKKPPQGDTRDTRWPIRIESRLNFYWIRRRYTSYTQHSFTCTVCLFMIVSRSRLFNVRTMFDFVVRLLIFPGIKASTLASHSQNEWNSSQDLKIKHDLRLFTLQSILFVHNTTWS